MDCFIKKIFENKGKDFSSDKLVHLQFQKFSRGEFKNKAAMIYSRTKGRYSISTAPEYANELVRAVAEKLGNNRAQVTGVIVSTKDLAGEIDFKDKKPSMGVNRYIIEKEMSGEEILNLCDRLPASFLGLSFSVPDKSTELKIKPKAPKTARPSMKSPEEEQIKADFCRLTTNDRVFVRSFVFDSEIDIDSVKRVKISHDFIVTEIILPKGEKDFGKMRELAKRKGRIVRKIDVDGVKSQKEAEFTA